jgi:hypothetical protein
MKEAKSSPAFRCTNSLNPRSAKIMKTDWRLDAPSIVN